MMKDKLCVMVFNDGYELNLTIPESDDLSRLLDLYSVIEEMELEHGTWIKIKKFEKNL